MSNTRLSMFPFALFLVALFPAQLSAECYYERAIQAEEFQIGIMLSWSTNMETDNERFIVEKSEDGVTFMEVGQVNSAGDSGDVQEYNFLHVYPQEKRLYYRLKQVDIVGTSSYSDIAIFQLEKQTEVRVLRLSDAFTAGEFEIKLDSYRTGELNYTLWTWSGNLIREETCQLINGVNDLSINTEGLVPGVYRVVLKTEEEIDRLTFQKMEGQEEQKTPMASKNNHENKNK